ncbi:MAG TPA: GNAT family N-acetyltransferase [Hymenobacter sp.]|jgi:ribosomal protein S18 acetylase RimI-like enzyme|uniref:GNAT family N-acetyltransferase n=1 Tax=Hymenobacter sp. TaxID=1898978 RepID=UPI002ED8FB95
MSASVRRLEPADLGWATALLVAACAELPVLRYCCTGPAAAAQRAWVLRQLLRFGLRFGRVYTNAEGSALAVWLSTKQPTATLYQLVRAGLLPAALWHFGWAGFQRLRSVRTTAAALQRQSTGLVEHYHLVALVVAPAYRGRGVGRRMLQAALAAMQATHAPCYLDTQQPEQLIFFQRLGFQLTGHCQLGPEANAPVNWGLVRPSTPDGPFH